MGAILDDDGDGEDDCAIADDLAMRFDRVLLYFQIQTCAMNDNDLAVYLLHRAALAQCSWQFRMQLQRQPHSTFANIWMTSRCDR